MGHRDGSLPSLSNDVDGIQHGDSRNLKENIEHRFGPSFTNREFIDVTLTSPPYADMIEYDTDRETQIGVGDTYEDYLEDLRTIFKETFEITKPSGSLWVVVNSFRENGQFIDLPGDVVDICENVYDIDICPDCGSALSVPNRSMPPTCEDCEYKTTTRSWTHHDTIIWDKVRARPYSNNTFRNVFEYIICFTKTDQPNFDFDRVRIADESELEKWWVDWPERYHPRGKIPDNVWEMVTPTQGGWNREWPGHPAPFPQQLVERIVQLTTRETDVVFDPFGGSGTTVAQALLMGRRAFGFEISGTYISNYFEVLEYLKDRWAARKENKDTVELQQDRLERTIWALRQLIYVKKAVTKLRANLKENHPELDSVDDMGLHSVLIDSTVPDPTTSDQKIETMETNYTYVFDSRDDRRLYLRQLQSFASEEPWNGFGINATIEVANLEEIQFADLPSGPNNPYLYTNGQHEKVARSVTQQAWSDAKSDPTRWRSQTAEKSCPALISNVFVSVERTDSGPELSLDLLEEPPEEDAIFGSVQINDTSGHIDTSLTDFF